MRVCTHIHVCNYCCLGDTESRKGAEDTAAARGARTLSPRTARDAPRTRSPLFGTRSDLSTPPRKASGTKAKTNKTPRKTKQKTQPISLQFILKILKDTASSKLVVAAPTCTIYVVKKPAEEPPFQEALQQQSCAAWMLLQEKIIHDTFVFIFCNVKKFQSSFKVSLDVEGTQIPTFANSLSLNLDLRHLQSSLLQLAMPHLSFLTPGWGRMPRIISSGRLR